MKSGRFGSIPDQSRRAVAALQAGASWPRTMAADRRSPLQRGGSLASCAAIQEGRYAVRGDGVRRRRVLTALPHYSSSQSLKVSGVERVALVQVTALIAALEPAHALLR